MKTLRRLRLARWSWIIAVAAAAVVSLGARAGLAHEIELGRVVVGHPWAEPAVAGASTRMFLTITNGGSSSLIVFGANAPIAAKTALVVRLDANTMRPLQSISIPPGEMLNLGTSHMWFQLSGLKRDLGHGSRFSAELELEEEHRLPFAVTVGAPLRPEHQRPEDSRR